MDNKEKQNLEIERKFLLTKRPAGKPLSRHRIRQAYIAREGGNVVRVRQQDDRYILCIKTPAGGISRHELEYEISAGEADILFKASAHKPVEKIREIYQGESHLWEVDFFSGENDGLIVAEVELSQEDETIIPPPWIGPEVSGLSKFYNANLSIRPFNQWGVRYEDLVARLMA